MTINQQTELLETAMFGAPGVYRLDAATEYYSIKLMNHWGGFIRSRSPKQLFAGVRRHYLKMKAEENSNRVN